MTLLPRPAAKFPLAALSYLAPFLLLLALSARELSESDTWWHLKTGELIVTQHHLPRTDPFSEANAGKPWVNFEWLSQVVFYLVYRMAGPPGLVAVSMLVIGLAFLCLALAGLNLRRPLLGSALLALSVIAASERYVARPEIFSFLFLGLFLLILHHYRQGRLDRTIWILPLLQVIWENLHGGTLLGIEIVGAYAVGELLLRKLPLPPGWKSPPLDRTRYLRLPAIFALVVLASLVNPWGPKTLLLIFKTQSHQFTMAHVVEWQRTFSLPRPWPPWVQAYWVWVALCLAGFALNFRRLDLNQLLLSLGFLVISLLAVRNLALFALVALPVTARNLSLAGEDLRIRERLQSFRRLNLLRPARAVLIAGLIFFCLGFSWWVATDRYYLHYRSLDRFGFEVSSVIYPWPMLDFLDRSGIQGPIFNDHDLGGYLIWREWPRYRPFLDSRAFIYDPAYLSDYSRALQDPEAWKNLADRRHLQAALLLHLSGETAPLFRILHQDPDWAPVYLDETGAIFVRNSPEHAGLIESHRLDLAKPESLTFTAPGTGRTRTRFGWFLLKPDPVPLLTAAFFYQNLGELGPAENFLQQALAVDPENPTARINQARLLDEMEQLRARPGRNRLEGR